MFSSKLMRRARKLTLPSGALLLALGTSAYAVECGMAEAFKQRDGNGKGGLTSVWSGEQSSSLLFIESLNVNTDGTSRSYSVDDFWGERTALNNLCNAMKDACAGLSKDELRKRRILTQQAFANGWPDAQLKASRISPSIIPFKNGKPCSPKNGFLISATALHKPAINDVCDTNNYVDSLIVPALVIPKNPSKTQLSEFAKRNAKVGDLVVAMVPGTAKPVFAVVGDTGPAGELGEGSLALNGSLLGKKAEPTNYLEVRGKGAFKGKAWTVPKAIVIVFPGSRDTANPFMTRDRIDESAQQRFEKWGGLERMNACAAAYR
ncbi:MAG: hypothetical protein A3I66_11590 [Burkholderiales bacterium RIFCSPLOWO2_02_FULL_57_36]|nr:MAG: hypothetical protein A3I66_11590 [Burkholderiales bacterium RIFCSPLOWO2_02_FULL_57_36]